MTLLHSQTRKSQLGVTLIELMISMALGIGLTLAVINIVMVTNRTSSLADGISQAQESGRFAISYLADGVRQAGYTTDSEGIEPFALLCANSTRIDHCSFDSTNDDEGDRIAIRRMVTETENKDCAGQDINTATPANNITADTVVIDAYWVEKDTDGETNLYCLTYKDPALQSDPVNSFGKNKQPIANGISAMHVLYGYSEEEDLGKDRNVTRYITAAELPNDPATGAINWRRVYSVKIALLAHSYEESSLKKKKRGYALLDSDAYIYDDSFSRQVFTTTIARANY